MPKKLFMFPTPANPQGVLVHDALGPHRPIQGVPDTHFSGRPGQSYTLPDDTPNGNGASLTSTIAGASRVDRGIVLLNDGTIPWPLDPRQEAAFLLDDYRITAT